MQRSLQSLGHENVLLTCICQYHTSHYHIHEKNPIIKVYSQLTKKHNAELIHDRQERTKAGVKFKTQKAESKGQDSNEVHYPSHSFQLEREKTSPD